MKRFLYFPLILLLVILLFTACGPQEIPSTDNSADLPATESVGTGTETLGTDQPDIDKTDAVRKRIRVLKLGLRPAKIESTDPSVAEGEITSDYLTLNGYRTGSATLNLTDYFGFTASISVTVDKEKDSIEYKVNECKDDFIEVGIDFGATGNSTTDDTAAFQKAIDAAKPGDTVYVYPGRYRVSLLVMREGVTLKLYTTMTNAKQGFSEEVKKAFDTNEIAILSGTRILNVENGTAGRKGCGNFSIIGGGFDTNLTNRSTLIFGSAKNVTLENVVFKDIMDNHVIQITGTSDITVKNCIFAGFLCGDNFTREVIQVEPSTPGATGGPIAYGEGEFTYPKNVTITGCYFGKSDEAGHLSLPSATTPEPGLPTQPTSGSSITFLTNVSMRPSVTTI